MKLETIRAMLLSLGTDDAARAAMQLAHHAAAWESGLTALRDAVELLIEYRDEPRYVRSWRRYMLL